ncbi:glycoside hydrolase family 2 protein [Lapillicoccus jejuensis]|uniref:Glycosyl hydrolase family 2 n=1 Tax=Lapillicoccus jejuensis TaxID=402171 RepID=A0A542E4V6_9MICO|nr:beta-mannosidase [Lapillicoccus jejuensis]TQJ10378.1 glycosyl hydrolase family 2 [Lapillicoccus jejuensis]
MRPTTRARWSIVVVAVLAALLPAVSSSPVAGAAVATGPTSVTSTPDPALVALAAAVRAHAPADVGTTTVGLGGWQVASTADDHGAGGAVSRVGYPTRGWLPVRPDDAGAPGTEITALLQNGVCPHVFFSDTMRRCFGTQTTGRETVARFAVPWWYRTTFATPARSGHVELVVNGVVGEADVWVNGHEVATHDEVTGAYTQHRIDVTALVRPHGQNVLAMKVHPNDPLRMFTVSDIDWSQIPPDQNTGIQFPVQVRGSDDVALDDAHVVQDTAADLSSTRLSVLGTVSNSADRPRRATVAAVVVPPDDRTEPVYATTEVLVPAHTSRAVAITPADAPSLVLHHPAVWWPYRMGGQPLYTTVTALLSDGHVVASTTSRLGIRTVSSRLVGPSTLAPDGVRQYTVDGRPIVLRGGGFQPDLFLRYSAADTDQQIRLLRSAGLDTIRVEGHFMPQDFYDRMDAAGILVASGFSCCDAWELPTDQPVSAPDLRVLGDSAANLARVLRDHPSVFTFQWSDNNPVPAQERVTLAAFHAEDLDVPVIASAENKSTPRLGPAGEKEGPYDWVPPSYWYDRTHTSYADDPSLTNDGGAWSLDSEQSAGHTVPTHDSMNRFLSADDQRRLWQDPTANQYHANAETGTTGYAFGTLANFDAALRARYGTWSDLDGYVREAQLANYENVRAQFEAFILHSHDAASPSTGTIYWMANKGWPTLLWDLYNADYDQAGSFFGAQEANRALHAIFDPATGTVAVDNLTGSGVSGLSVTADVVRPDGTVLDRGRGAVGTVPSEGLRTGVVHLTVPAATAPPQRATTYLVRLVLHRDGRVVDRSTYWYSTQADVVDWPATLGNPQATMVRYGDLTGLRDLPTATVRMSSTTTSAGGWSRTTVTLENTSPRATALFLRADVRRGRADGAPYGGDDQVRTATWDVDDVSLAPGERQVLTATYPTEDLQGAAPVVTLTGWNVRSAHGRG